MTEAASWTVLLLQLFLVDLVLGADNAIVIGFACRGLAPADAKRAALLGAAGAITLRLCMVMFANALLDTPFVKLLAAWILVAVALNVQARKSEETLGSKATTATGDFASAAALIVVADAAMSLDNVVALASIAAANYWALAIGVLMSIPIIVYGAIILTRVMDRVPEVLLLGAAFLGWVAGGMAVSDPLVAGWVASYAPALPYIAPALLAGFVLVAGAKTKPSRTRGLTPERLAAGSPAPRPRPLAVVGVPSLYCIEAEANPRREGEPIVPGPSALTSPPIQPIPAQTTGIETPVPSPALQALPSFALARPLLGLTEEQSLVAGLVLLTGLAGFMLAAATYLDSLF